MFDIKRKSKVQFDCFLCALVQFVRFLTSKALFYYLYLPREGVNI